MTSDTSALALRAAMSAAPLVATTAAGPGPRTPRRGEFAGERSTAGKCESEDPVPGGVRGYCRGTSVGDPGKERLDDRRVDAVELLVLERSDRRGDIDGGSESRFLRRSLFRCVFEPGRGDSLNGNERLLHVADRRRMQRTGPR